VDALAAMTEAQYLSWATVRQAGPGYTQRFFSAMRGYTGPVIAELFSPASREFLQQMADALPNFTLEVSLESHDPVVRHAFGKHYDNEPIDAQIADALDVVQSDWMSSSWRVAAPDRRIGAPAPSTTARICCAASAATAG